MTSTGAPAASASSARPASMASASCESVSPVRASCRGVWKPTVIPESDSAHRLAADSGRLGVRSCDCEETLGGQIGSSGGISTMARASACTDARRLNRYTAHDAGEIGLPLVRPLKPLEVERERTVERRARQERWRSRPLDAGSES